MDWILLFRHKIGIWVLFGAGEKVVFDLSHPFHHAMSFLECCCYQDCEYVTIWYCNLMTWFTFHAMIHFVFVSSFQLGCFCFEEFIPDLFARHETPFHHSIVWQVYYVNSWFSFLFSCHALSTLFREHACMKIGWVSVLVCLTGIFLEHDSMWIGHYLYFAHFTGIYRHTCTDHTCFARILSYFYILLFFVDSKLYLILVVSDWQLTLQ